ncbi:MAG: bacillithiol system redox-active protein YtxJ [Candidatus Hydrogenedentes bacterium]|nr:bacillithiol system redox-active protein YtxJ [Candidatus Hydrogenedentota bacterium]
MKQLNSVEQFEAALVDSDAQRVFVFKHSTACPVSAVAYEQVQRYETAASSDSPPVYLVKVIEARPVSNEIAKRLAVTHQSPQLILVKGRKAVWSATHFGIQQRAIEEALNKL